MLACQPAPLDDGQIGLEQSFLNPTLLVAIELLGCFTIPNRRKMKPLMRSRGGLVLPRTEDRSSIADEDIEFVQGDRRCCDWLGYVEAWPVSHGDIDSRSVAASTPHTSGDGEIDSRSEMRPDRLDHPSATTRPSTTLLEDPS